MKKQLAKFRSGWQSENLARYILSNFAFIAQPSTVADDIGTDFFCTIFEVLPAGKNSYLSPKESFAIQIKSNERKFSISNKKDYLQGLQIPFFVGVINKEKKELDLFTGEYLIPFFIDNPKAAKIRVNLNRTDNPNIFDYSEESAEFTVNFPKFLTIGSNPDSPDFISNIQKLSKTCRIITRNITRMNNREFIFFDSLRPDFHIVERDDLIQKSLSVRLSNLSMELSYLLENNYIDTRKEEYKAIRDAIFKVL